jgi:hypothetical protein
LLFSLLEDEASIKQNMPLIYRHISFRASKILESKKFHSVLRTSEPNQKAHLGSYA